MKLDGSMNEEQKIIKDSFEEYCRKKIDPSYERWINEKEFPRDIMKDLSKLVLAATIPSASGEKIDEVTLGILSESMGKHELPVPAFLSMHFSKLLPLINDESSREDYIRRYLSGDLVICGAFTEPGYGSDSASISTEAKLDNGEYTITGEKAFVSSPGIADAYILSVKTAEMSWENRHKSLSLVIINGSSKGLEPYEMVNMASVFKGDFGGVRLNGVKAPAGNIIGMENRGFQVLMNILSIQRVHVGLYAIGLAESALEEAIEYAKLRKAFGQSISKYQAISFRLAEDWAKLESAKALAFKALAMQDAGLENSAESAAVKGYGCEIAFEAVSHSLQTLGASGYVKTSTIERKFRASRGFLIGDGTPEVQKLIIARKLFGKEYSP